MDLSLLRKLSFFPLPLLQFYQLAARYAINSGNFLAVSTPMSSSPLTVVETAELRKFANARNVLLAPFQKHTKYAKCTSYNIVYRGAQHKGMHRDCYIACDYLFGEQLVRCYGQIQFFTSAVHGQRRDLRVYVAYVEWFQREQQHSGSVSVPWVYREFSKSADLQRFIPMADIVCKVALLPAQAKTKYTVLELW